MTGYIGSQEKRLNNLIDNGYIDNTISGWTKSDEAAITLNQGGGYITYIKSNTTAARISKDFITSTFTYVESSDTYSEYRTSTFYAGSSYTFDSTSGYFTVSQTTSIALSSTGASNATGKYIVNYATASGTYTGTTIYYIVNASYNSSTKLNLTLQPISSSILNNQIIYAQVKIKSSSSNSSYPMVQLRRDVNGTRDYNSLESIDGITGTSLNDNQWHVLSTYLPTYDGTNYGTYDRIRLQFYSSVVNDTFDFKDVMIINLTSAFGSGNEPTKEWCDEHVVVLNNIVPDGNMESSSWSGGNYSTTEKLFGSRSQYFPANSTTVQTISTPTMPVVGHKYYGRHYLKTDGNVTAADCRFEWYAGDGPGLNFVFGWNQGNYPDWTMESSIITVDAVNGSSYVCRSFDVNNTGAVWADGLMIVDLTEAFGAGNEPTKQWCDEHISQESSLIICFIDDGQPGFAHKIQKMYIGIDGVARTVKRAYIGIDNVARLWYTEHIPSLAEVFSTMNGYSFAGPSVSTAATASIELSTNSRFVEGADIFLFLTVGGSLEISRLHVDSLTSVSKTRLSLTAASDATAQSSSISGTTVTTDNAVYSCTFGAFYFDSTYHPDMIEYVFRNCYKSKLKYYYSSSVASNATSSSNLRYTVSSLSGKKGILFPMFTGSDAASTATWYRCFSASTCDDPLTVIIGGQSSSWLTTRPAIYQATYSSTDYLYPTVTGSAPVKNCRSYCLHNLYEDW